MLTLAGTIVALVSGAVGLLFVLKPDLKPSGKAAKQAATLSQASFEQSAPYSEYLAKTNVTTGPYTKRLLARRGALVGVHVAVTGYKGNHLLLIWKLFAQPSGSQIDESRRRHRRRTKSPLLTKRPNVPRSSGCRCQADQGSSSPTSS